MTAVDHDLQRRWLDELRSGNREQGFGALCRGTGKDAVWCCQGIACDLVDPDGWRHNSHFAGRIWRHRWVGYWSPDLLDALGLPAGATGTLSAANDRPTSFAEIADTAEQMMRDNGTHWEQAT